MIFHFGTTTLILLWCFFITFAWCQLLYPLVSRGIIPHFLTRPWPLVPTLILGPVSVVAARQFFHWDLLYPTSTLASFFDLWIGAMIPATILTIASGWVGHIGSSLAQEYSFWKSKPFVWSGLSFGVPIEASVRKIVILKSYSETCSRSLPWLFGEIMIVESLFNAPGLGLDAWRAARRRDYLSLWESLIWILALYLVIQCLNSLLHQRLGKKLRGYL